MSRISLFFYGLCLGTAQMLKTDTYKPFIIPFAWLIGVGAFFFAKNYSEINEFLFQSYVPLNIVMGAALPLLFLLITIMMKKKKPV